MDLPDPPTIPIEVKPARSRHQLPAIKEWLESQPEWPMGRGAGSNKSSRFIIDHKGLHLESADMNLSFHPSMALLRLINLQRGEQDRFGAATRLNRGDVLLDATLGLASDALIGAWAVGKEGKVIGLESSLELSLLLRQGLYQLNQSVFLPYTENADKKQAWAALAQAAGRIDVLWEDHLDFLTRQPDRSVDVVYFDPMFKHTRKRSASIQPLHAWASHTPLRAEAVREACRVARKRVVLKGETGGNIFHQLGFALLPGGAYSQVSYGVIELT